MRGSLTWQVVQELFTGDNDNGTTPLSASMKHVLNNALCSELLLPEEHLLAATKCAALNCNGYLKLSSVNSLMKCRYLCVCVCVCVCCYNSVLLSL